MACGGGSDEPADTPRAMTAAMTSPRRSRDAPDSDTCLTKAQTWVSADAGLARRAGGGLRDGETICAARGATPQARLASSPGSRRAGLASPLRAVVFSHGHAREPSTRPPQSGRGRAVTNVATCLLGNRALSLVARRSSLVPRTDGTETSASRQAPGRCQTVRNGTHGIICEQTCSLCSGSPTLCPFG